MRQPSLACALFLAFSSATYEARADFASPPDDRGESFAYGRYGSNHPTGRPLSWIRASTGPVARLSDQAAMGGLMAALEIGKSGAGFRTAAAWTGTGWDKGHAQYSGEIWVDFGVKGAVRPAVSAGAALVRLDALPAGADTVITRTLGAAVLRGALGMALPVDDADARAGLEATVTLPATQDGPGSTRPWVLLSAVVGVGF